MARHNQPSMSTPVASPLRARISRGEAVALELERIIGEDYEQGQLVGTKHQLRERFRVAVATINEAIRLLETRGIVETRPGPGGGVFVGGAATRLAFSNLVLGFSSGSVAYTECLEIRDSLEPAVCAHAARHHRPSDIKMMRTLLARMSGEDPTVYFDANWALHREIAALCLNPPMRSMYLAMLEFMEQSVSSAEIGTFDFAGFRRVHEELVAAIDDGGAQRLERAVREHRPTQEMLLAAGQAPSP